MLLRNAFSLTSLFVLAALASTSCSSSGTDALFSGSDAPDSGADEDGGSGGQGGEGGSGGDGGSGGVGGSGGDGGSGGAGGDGGQGGQGGGGPHCAAGTWICEGSVARSCDGAGGFTETQNCAAQGKLCHEGLGCVSCVPGSSSCADGITKICNAEGTGFDREYVCDELQGMTCTSSGCHGACAPGLLGSSHTGCDFYPTVTFNPVWSGFEFAVAVANPGTELASITVTRGDQLIESDLVAPGATRVIKLPWISELKGPESNGGLLQDPGDTRIVKNGSYRLRSTQPVAVYQFSPIDYEIKPKPAGCPDLSSPGRCLSYTSDASLLLPAHGMGQSYTVLSWPSKTASVSFYAVTATEDGTVVTLEGTGDATAAAGIDATGSGIVALNRGDVLAVVGAHGGLVTGDISGSRVRANKPVQVIGGHSCANVPSNFSACDHIEETMLPAEALGKEYLVTSPAGPDDSSSPHTIRIAATVANTTVTFDPPTRAPVVLNPGEQPFELLNIKGDVRISGAQPIVVGHYMQGSEAVPSKKGDPSQTLAIATEQFRTSYLFFAPATYEANFVNVIAKVGSIVTLDGVAIPESSFVQIGDSAYGVARRRLSQGEVHKAESAEPFGIVVYGYGEYTSYMYPGGAGLRDLTTTP